MTLLAITIENAISITGLLLSVTAILFTAFTIQKNNKVNTANFWLDLRQRFSEFDEVHLKLRPGGDWRKNNSGPENTQDWVKLEAYMGLFEHCNIMLNDGLIDEKTFENIYAYRLRNIVANEAITNAKLKSQNKKHWVDFIDLLEKFEITY